jgi:hypothetical protein
MKFMRFTFGGWLLTVFGYSLRQSRASGLHLFKNAKEPGGLGFRKIF